MSTDICTIGRHKLDISNVKVLAEQLSEKWNINIKYGYEDTIRYNPIKHSIKFDYTDNWIEQGMIFKNPSSYLVYILKDETYAAKNLERKLGNRINDLIFEEDCKYAFFEALNESCRFDLNIEYSRKLIEKECKNTGNFVYYASFYQHAIDFNLYVDLPQWSSLVDTFYINPRDSDYTTLKEFRIDLKRFLLPIGCTEIIHFPDQGAPELIEEQLHLPWPDIMNYILEGKFNEEYSNNHKEMFFLKNLKPKVLHIPQFYKAENKEYNDFDIYTDNLEEDI
ncbi:MAG: hypothetical protein ACOCWG_02690 [bacterium]